MIETIQKYIKTQLVYVVQNCMDRAGFHAVNPETRTMIENIMTRKSNLLTLPPPDFEIKILAKQVSSATRPQGKILSMG